MDGCTTYIPVWVECQSLFIVWWSLMCHLNLYLISQQGKFTSIVGVIVIQDLGLPGACARKLWLLHGQCTRPVAGCRWNSGTGRRRPRQESWGDKSPSSISTSVSRLGREMKDESFISIIFEDLFYIKRPDCGYTIHQKTEEKKRKKCLIWPSILSSEKNFLFALTLLLIECYCYCKSKAALSTLFFCHDLYPNKTRLQSIPIMELGTPLIRDEPLHLIISTCTADEWYKIWQNLATFCARDTVWTEVGADISI